MAVVELNLGGVKGTVDVGELMDGDMNPHGHGVRFFHVKFNHPNPDVKPVDLAAAIAAYPYDFYDQCRSVASLNLPAGEGISPDLWGRVGENLENDVKTIRSVHKEYGIIPVCAAFLASWYRDYPVELLDFRMCISTHN
ncbi:MAG: hypothetical protein JWL77_4430 [Chthonomonadaceae bacterium]|nr:hypothetical protein [Chthonomonadaceae bacterium]